MDDSVASYVHHELDSVESRGGAAVRKLLCNGRSDTACDRPLANHYEAEEYPRLGLFEQEVNSIASNTPWYFSKTTCSAIPTTTLPALSKEMFIVARFVEQDWMV